MGFTPINVCGPNGAISSSFGDSALLIQAHHQHKSSDAIGNGRNRQTRTVASDYLGRDDETVSVPANVQNTRVTRSSKRRKISQVSESVPATKPTNGKSKARRTKRTEENDSANATSELVQSQPVSLFSSSTLMGSLSTPAAQTTFDAMKASKGYGTIVYSSSPAEQPKKKELTTISKPKKSTQPVVTSSRTLSEDFMIGDDDDMDDALARISEIAEASDQPGNAASEKEDAPIAKVGTPLDVAPAQGAQTPPARQWKLNMHEVDRDEDYGGALLSEAEKKILGTVIPRSSLSCLLPYPSCTLHRALANFPVDDLKTKQATGVKPVVRTPFPRPILDRSPLFGASSGTMLRTCFRIGEALKEGSASARSNNNVIVELYARVTSSHREGRKQHFVLHDLYHDRPPYLEGICQLWNQSKLWELDTRSFLTAGKQSEGVMCRAIARMKRREGADGKGWLLEVLSIWQASWEDIDFIAGICGKERDTAAANDKD